jgi:FkbM family methyltransferase
VDFLTRVGEHLRDAIELGPSFALRHGSFLLGRTRHRATINGARVWLRRGTTDALMFRQIFRKGDWDFTRFAQASRVTAAYERMLAAGERPVIVDAGANVGAASLWLAAKFPRASIVAVEPDSDNAEMCRLNTADVPSITVVEAALGAVPGTVMLENSRGSALTVRAPRAREGGVPVRTMTDLAAGGRLLAVKLDIEGFESDLFSTDTGWLDAVALVMIEPHDWMFPGEFSSATLQRTMAQQRFELLISGENLFYVR